MFHVRRVWLLKTAIAILAGVAFLQASAARADYTLSILVTDNRGNVGTTTTGPFSGPGAALIFDLGVLFPEFSSLSIAVTANESGAGSFLNEVDISGVTKTGFAGTTNLSVTVTGSGFDNPVGLVTADQAISSASVPVPGQPANFTSATLTGELGPGSPATTVVANQTIHTPPANSGIATANVTVNPVYDALLMVGVNGIAQTSTNDFNVNADLGWTSATPEPASVVLVLTALPVIGASWLRRKRGCRKES
jgi:hypothetical protein